LDRHNEAVAHFVVRIEEVAYLEAEMAAYFQERFEGPDRPTLMLVRREAAHVAVLKLSNGGQVSVAIERSDAVRDDDDDLLSGYPNPLRNRPDRIGEVLEDVRREYVVN
jgi:hypothetical protein